MKNALGHPGGTFFQIHSLSSSLPHCPVCQVCSRKLGCFPDLSPIYSISRRPVPRCPVPRAQSRLRGTSLWPSAYAPTCTLASFSCHFLHDSWAAIFRTDLTVSVSSLQSCAFRTWPAPSPSVTWCPAALTPPFHSTVLCLCCLEGI